MTWRDRPTALVALREIRDAVRSKGYRITLVLSIAALVAIIVVGSVVGDDSDRRHVVVAGGDPALVERVDALGSLVGVDIRVSAAPDDAAAVAAVRGGDADVAVSEDRARLVTEEPLDLARGSSLADVVNLLRAELALENGLRAVGLDAEQAAAVRATEPPAIEALEAGDDVDEERVGAVLVINILLFLMLQTYGSWVLVGVSREKASRVVEVLLAVITPRQLLVGKLAGIGAVALLHAAALIVAALVAARAVGADPTAGLAIGDVAVAAVWFVLGYALYCGAFAAAGSLVPRVEDAQGAAIPIVAPLLLAYLVSFSAAGGASELLWVLAFVPPTAVLAMPSLAAVTDVPPWAIALSMAMTLAAVAGVALLAARIYERSVLRTARKVRWRDALRSRGDVSAAA